MKTFQKLLLLFFLPLTILSCKKKKEEIPLEPTPKSIEVNAQTLGVINTSNAFGIDLFKKTAQTEEKNMMLSPLSASIALTMLLNGSEAATYSQIASTLNYPPLLTTAEINASYKNLVSQLLTVDPDVNIKIANAVFYKNGFIVKQPFINAMSSAFDAHIQGLNFGQPGALTTINNWASTNTMGKIPKVLDEISQDAVMFLMNALYFKGNWTYKFKKTETVNAPFTLETGNSINVSTMNGDVIAKQTSSAAYTAIELPYGRTNFAMVIIVPTATLSSFLHQFDVSVWNEITASFDAREKGSLVRVALPSFKFSYEKVLNAQLKSMGMLDAFVPFIANLNGISDHQLYVDFVKQNTFVDVNEDGTEAAAVTTIGVNFVSLPLPFTVNKPFIFAIRERTSKSLLFMGKVINPNLN